METWEEQIGARVRALRQRKGWSQEQLAQATRLSPKTVSLAECGAKLPGTRTVSQLAEALHTSVDFLLGGGRKSPRAAVSGEDRRLLALVSRLDPKRRQVATQLLEDMAVASARSAPRRAVTRRR